MAVPETGDLTWSFLEESQRVFELLLLVTSHSLNGRHLLVDYHQFHLYQFALKFFVLLT